MSGKSTEGRENRQRDVITAGRDDKGRDVKAVDVIAPGGADHDLPVTCGDEGREGT